jgi:hypothetical protein
MNRSKHSIWPCTLLFLTATLNLIYSCDDNPASQEDVSTTSYIEKYSGDNQIERVGTTLPENLTVRVKNIIGTPLAGRRVIFSTADAGAVVSPDTTITDGYGMASCRFTLGTNTGTQHVGAATSDDSTTFTATADPINCEEENPQPSCQWPAGLIYITTTSSSRIQGSGSVLLEFDPETESLETILQTDSTIVDLSFSSRGELFLSTHHTILKVTPETHQLDNFCSYPSGWIPELVSNPGGIMAGLSEDEIFMVMCPETGITNIINTPSGTNTENFTITSSNRNIFIIKGEGPSFHLEEHAWDGRTSSSSNLQDYYLNEGTGTPVGMCSDSTGNVYITFNDQLSRNFKRIARVSSSGEVDEDFFDFYQHAGGNNTEAGQWGDITFLDGNLYLIDKLNDRLVIISEDGTWIDDIDNDSFSKPSVYDERYGIAASPRYTTCAPE